MPDVSYHGWTHRPKAQGGTDPIEFPGTAMPFAFATLVDTVTLTDSDEYSIGSAGFAGTATGVAEKLFIGNDNAATTFDVIEPFKSIRVKNGVAGLFAYDAFVEFASNFAGAATMYPDTDFNMWDANEAVTEFSPYHLREWVEFTGSESYTSMRMSGVALLESPNNTQFFTVTVQQFSGSDQDITRAWMLVTKLCDTSEGPNQVYP